MNNNDIVKELQTRGYDAELHEVIKNGVSMKGSSAGKSGAPRPFSQFLIVPTLFPSAFAKSICDNPALLRE